MKEYFEHFRFHVEHAGWRLLLFLIVMVVNGVLDSLGIALFLPLVEFALTEGNELSALSNTLLSLLVALGLPVSLVSILVFLCSVFALKGLLMFGGAMLTAYMRIDLEENLRAKLAVAIRRASYAYVMSKKIGDFNAVFDTEIGGVLHNLNAMTNALGALGTVSIYIAAAFWVDPLVGGLSVAFGLILGAAIRGISARIRDISRAVTRTNAYVETIFLDFLNNFKYLKATETAGPMIAFLRRVLMRRRGLFIRRVVLRSILNAALEPLAIIVVAGFIFFTVDGQVQAMGTTVLSLAYLYRSLSRVGVVHQSWQAFGASVGSIEAVRRVFAALEEAREDSTGSPPAPLSQGIRAVAATVELGGKRVLDGVDFEIPKGALVGIVGDTGAGKSTLADVIGGLRHPDGGAVYRDGVDYRDLDLPAMRRRIGYVTQEPMLFHGSVAANVTLWREEPAGHAEASEALIEALRGAQALGFVERLSEGVATVIGERGHRLSGGEIQRLAIAREFYRDIDLLLFDEATSALDAQTDHLVIEAIRAFAARRTVLMISHRIANLRWCDKIYVMVDGRIERSGTWSELSADAEGWFSKALTLQRIGREASR